MASHPGPAVAVTTVVTALAAGAGRGAVGCLGVALAVLSGQLSVGWCNDAHDAAADARAGRRDKPIVAGLVGVRAVAVAALIALLLVIPLSWWGFGPIGGGWHVLAVSCAWLYDLVLARTVWSGVPYVVAFGSIPLAVTGSLQPPSWPAPWSVAACACMGLGAHLANSLPDLASDQAAGRGGALADRLGAGRARLLAVLLLLAATVLIAVGPGRPGPLTVVVLVAVAGIAVTASIWRSGNLLFEAVLVLAVVDAILLVSTSGSLVVA